jgi:hypothetical protein
LTKLVGPRLNDGRLARRPERLDIDQVDMPPPRPRRATFRDPGRDRSLGCAHAGVTPPASPGDEAAEAGRQREHYTGTRLDGFDRGRLSIRDAAPPMLT